MKHCLKRSSWVSSVWNQAASNHNIVHPPLEEFDWKKPDSHTLLIDWESERNNYVTCKCKNRNSYCSPGCKCTNLPVEALAAEQEDTDSAVRISEIAEQSDAELSSSDNDGSHLDVEVNQLMRDIFGDSEGEDFTAQESVSDLHINWDTNSH